MPSYFTGANWYKGALHCHTSVSDGAVPPLELIRRYRARGFSFAAITDHDFLGYYPESEDDAFVCLAGAELIQRVDEFNDKYRGTHIVTLARELSGEFGTLGVRVEYKDTTSVSDLNSYLLRRRQAGNMMILAHPYWSYLDFEDVARLNHCFAMELFNGVANSMGLGESLPYWDYALRRGKRIFGVATDDHHALGGDFAAGWVCVRADILSRQAIFESLLSGNFYSSTGPAILDYGIDSGKVYVRSAPARAIRFIAYGPDCEPDLTILNNPGPFEYGEYKLTGRESYVRAEVVGVDGGHAWTNPVFF